MSGSVTSDLRRLAVRIRVSPAALAEEAANEIEEALREQAAKDTHGSMRLSGLMGVGRLETKSQVRPFAGGAEATITVSPSAPWTILEDGTRAHSISVRKGRKARHPTAAMDIGGTGTVFRRGTVHVRGVRGKQTFTRGTEAGMPRAIALAHQQFSELLRVA